MAGVDVGGFLGTNFDGDKAIEKIMESENKKKDPILNKQFNATMQQESWVALRQTLSALNTASRNLYSPLYTPFRKIKTNTDENSLITIDSSKIDPKKTKPGDYKLTPKQMAKAAYFLSDSMDTNKQLEAMNFSILYKGKNYQISFNGGTLKELAELLNEKIGSFAEVEVKEVEDGKSVLSIKGKNVGKKEAIQFSGDLNALEKIGLLKKDSKGLKDLKITNKNGLESKDNLDSIITKKGLLLEPAESIKKTLDIGEIINTDSQLIIYYTTKTPDPSKNKDSIVKINKNDNSIIQGFVDKLWVGDASLYGESLISSLPKSKEVGKDNPLNNPLSQADENHLLGVNVGATPKNFEKTAPYTATSKTQKIVINLDKGSMNFLELANQGTLAINIEKVELSVGKNGSLVPKNEISKAQNAIINYQGIDYERDKNTIDDIIPGVTFTINGESKKPIDVKLDWDYEEVTSMLSEFILAYNNSMDFFKKMTKSDVDKNLLKDQTFRPSYNELLALKKAAYDKLSDQDKKAAAQDGSLFEGYLSSDSSIKTIRSKLQALTVAPYKTDIGKKLMFLSQLNIKRPSMRDVNTSSQEDQDNFYAGYLEFTKKDRESFLSFLKENYEAVQQLFFQKSAPSQLLYDKGLAVEINWLLDKIVANNFRGDDKRVYPGLIQVKVNSLDLEKARYSRQLSDFDKRLKREEDKLKRQFAGVYRAQSQARANQAQLDKFGK